MPEIEEDRFVVARSDMRIHNFLANRNCLTFIEFDTVSRNGLVLGFGYSNYENQTKEKNILFHLQRINQHKESNGRPR
jgi:hypothetical protein